MVVNNEKYYKYIDRSTFQNLTKNSLSINKEEFDKIESFFRKDFYGGVPSERFNDISLFITSKGIRENPELPEFFRIFKLEDEWYATFLVYPNTEMYKERHGLNEYFLCDQIDGLKMLIWNMFNGSLSFSGNGIESIH